MVEKLFQATNSEYRGPRQTYTPDFTRPDSERNAKILTVANALLAEFESVELPDFAAFAQDSSANDCLALKNRCENILKEISDFNVYRNYWSAPRIKYEPCVLAALDRMKEIEGICKKGIAELEKKNKKPVLRLLQSLTVECGKD